MKKSCSVFAAAIIASGISINALADIIDKVEKSFDVAAGSELTVENINGEVTITAWKQNVVQVTATITADNEKDRERVEVQMKESSRGVSVKTHYNNERRWNNHSDAEVEYDIKVPAFINLASIELVNGSLTIENVEGEMEVELVNGSVKIEGAKSDSKVSSVNGSIKVSYQESVSNLQDIDLATVNGSVKLKIPGNVGAKFDIETMHGSIKNDFGLQGDEGKFFGKSLNGTVGDGQVDIDIESVNGSVKVSKH